jgi:hypothetical protein
LIVLQLQSYLVSLALSILTRGFWNSLTYDFYKNHENNISEKNLEDFQSIMKNNGTIFSPILIIIGNINNGHIKWKVYEIDEKGYSKI